jgi:ABC-type transport system substrate-binding protein
MRTVFSWSNRCFFPQGILLFFFSGMALRKVTTCFVGLLFLCCLNWSCSSSSNGNTAHGYFVYNEASGITSLDPAFSRSLSVIWAVHQLFNTLVETDEQLKTKPSLAQSWEFLDGGKTIRFVLRNDVFFHDHPVFPDGKGRKMVASDVVFSLLRLLDPVTASPGRWLLNGRLDSLQPFTVESDSVLFLHLSAPFGPILGVLSTPYCSIVPRELVEEYGKDFRKHPVGTGPFQFGFWEEGQALVLRKNPRYFEKDSLGKTLPYLPGVMVRFLDNKASEFLEFKQKKLHFINDVDASFKDEVLTKSGTLRSGWASQVRLNKHPYLNIEYLGLQQSDGSVYAQNRKVRQAIGYAINRKKMMQYLRNGIGKPAEQGFIPIGLPSFDSSLQGFSYQPEKSKILLAEAGFPNGNGLPPLILQTIPMYADLGSFIVRELQQVGIPAEVESVRKNLLLDLMAGGRAGFFRGSWIADYPDAENYLSVFYGENPAPPNYTRFNQPIFNQCYLQSIRTTEETTRTALYRKMDSIIIAEAPVIPLWYDEVIHLVQPEVEQFHPNALNLLELRRVKIKNK